MTSTYSPSLKIQLIANGDQSGVWGTTTNNNWELMEQAVAGVQSITMTNADYVLSNLNGVSDEARNMVIVAGGAGKHSMWVPTFGATRSVTRAIAKSDGTPWLPSDF